MRIIVAPDSFKECLTAPQVANAISQGWRRAAPNDELIELPLADGGEGTTDILVRAKHGVLQDCQVEGPLGEQIIAYYGVIDDGHTAIIEVAQASGLQRVSENERDALRSSSYGTGELMSAALAAGVKKLVIGLGGSACTDAGAGMLQALGAKLTDAQGHDIVRGGGALNTLANIDLSVVLERLAGVQVFVATDVTNPLLGPTGTAQIFSPQKGAEANAVALLEFGIAHFSACASAHGLDVNSFPGSGAAGGIGGALGGFLGAQIGSGVHTVMDALDFEQMLQGADLVITGEGSMDSQSAAGKVPAGVCELAKRNGVPVIGVAGVVGENLDALYDIGLAAVFSIVQGPSSKLDAMNNAPQQLAHTAEQIARVIHATR
ncbi:MAG: glycerate kinase [Gammaproteobacteria bacterium]